MKTPLNFLMNTLGGAGKIRGKGIMMVEAHDAFSKISSYL